MNLGDGCNAIREEGRSGASPLPVSATMVTGAPIRPHLLEQQIGWGAALLRSSIRLIQSCRIQILLILRMFTLI